MLSRCLFYCPFTDFEQSKIQIYHENKSYMYSSTASQTVQKISCESRHFITSFKVKRKIQYNHGQIQKIQKAGKEAYGGPAV